MNRAQVFRQPGGCSSSVTRWLTGRLMPDFKTIADFRKDNGPAIRKVCARFIELCREMKLFTDAMVAIDGSKFKAVNNRDRNFTQQKVKSRMEHLEKAVKHYLDDLDRADREPTCVPEIRVSQLKEKIATIKAEMRKLTKIKNELPKTESQQISLTDPDARSMNSAGKGTGTVGYNVQTAVDTKNHMIVAWMGATHFLSKTLPKVRTEMSLHVLAYNLKRAMKILGTRPLLLAIRA